MKTSTILNSLTPKNISSVTAKHFIYNQNSQFTPQHNLRKSTNYTGELSHSVKRGDWKKSSRRTRRAQKFKLWNRKKVSLRHQCLRYSENYTRSLNLKHVMWKNMGLRIQKWCQNHHWNMTIMCCRVMGEESYELNIDCLYTTVHRLLFILRMQSNEAVLYLLKWNHTECSDIKKNFGYSILHLCLPLFLNCFYWDRFYSLTITLQFSF